DQHTTYPEGRDHRLVRVHAEAIQPQDVRRRPRAGRSDVAQPSGAQQLARVRPQGPEVGRARPQPEDLRQHGGGGARRMLVVPRPGLLPRPPHGARRGQGQRGAPVAGVARVHLARARRHGVRRGHEPDAADGHRRDVRPPARPARRAGHGGAHGLGGLRQHVHPIQRGVGDRGPRVLQGVPAAAGGAVGRVRNAGM
ncbi:MAG: hypothetical protein AVDCRST_MAG50-2754, partial [uncultured Acidimicrobiales bacterium]